MSAAVRMISLPTAVEPVKEILSTAGWATSARPAVSPKPGTMLTTPSGRPASRQSWPSQSPLSGVSSATFTTTVLPQASAGATFQATIRSGKFHGVMMPQTPYGSRSV